MFRQALLFAAVEVFDRRQLLEVVLDAGGEIVGVRVQQLQLRLPLRALALPTSFEPEPFAEPRPLRADHRHDGAGKERDRQPAHAAILAGLNHPLGPADNAEHELARPCRSVPGFLGHPDARALRPREVAAADLRSLRAPVRAPRAGRDGLLLRPLSHRKLALEHQV